MRKFLFVAACFAVAGCDKATGSSTSTVTGTLTRETFPEEPRSISATNEKGVWIATPANGSGPFKLSLRKGHTYRLAVTLADRSVPIVFPRASGLLDPSFRVSGGAALVNLGAVRHLAAAPTVGFHMQALSESAPADSASAQGGGECEDGVDVATGAACIDDEGQMSCEEHDDDDDVDGNFEGDGECENGVDATTGGACTDAADGDGEAEDTDEVSPEGPMAVAEHNAPNDVGGCDDEDEDDGEGEHEHED